MPFKNPITRLSQLVADTLTGAVIQTAATGNRVRLGGDDPTRIVFNPGANVSRLSAEGSVTVRQAADGIRDELVVTGPSGFPWLTQNWFRTVPQLILTGYTGTRSGGQPGEVKLLGGERIILDSPEVRADTKVQAGVVTLTPSAANNPTFVPVPFPTPFPPGKVPAVVLTPEAASPADISLAVRAVTETGFNAVCQRGSVTAFPCHWIAVVP